MSKCGLSHPARMNSQTAAEPVPGPLCGVGPEVSNAFYAYGVDIDRYLRQYRR